MRRDIARYWAVLAMPAMSARRAIMNLIENLKARL